MIASDYVHSHASRVDEVMTPNVWTVTEETLLGDIVTHMEKHRMKRLPVARTSLSRPSNDNMGATAP